MRQGKRFNAGEDMTGALSVRLFEEEKEKIGRMALAAGLSVSEFVRMTLLETGNETRRTVDGKRHSTAA